MSYTWNSTSGYYEENGQKARIIYLNFNKLEANKNVPASNVVYTNEAMGIAPTPSQNTAVIMNAIQNLVKIEKGVVVYDKGADICNALNARNVSFYDLNGNDVKLVYVTDTTGLEANTYSTIHVGQNNGSKDATISAAVSAGAVSITEVTGNPSTVYAGDTAFAKGFVLTNNTGLNNDAKNWGSDAINTMVSIIDRAGTRLAGIYTCADGDVNSIEDFRDTKADCEKQILFWEKNPVDTSDKGHWIVYEGGEKLTKKVIVLDFDGITAADGVTYTNEAMNITAADGYNVTGSAAIADATRIQGIVDALNNGQSEYQFMANTSALSVANGQYNTIYVGNFTGLPGEGAKYTSIAETTAGLTDASGNLIWQKSFGNGFVLVQNMMDKSDANIVEYIQNAVGHVTGTYSHDEDGTRTLDDFYEGTVTGPSGEVWDPNALGGKGSLVDANGNAIRLVQLVFDDAETTYTNVNDDLMSQDPGSRAWRQFNYKNIPVTMQCAVMDSEMQQNICAAMNNKNLTFIKTVDDVDYTVAVKFVIGTTDAPVSSTIYVGRNSNRTYGTDSSYGDSFQHWLTGLPMEQCLLTTSGKQNKTTYTGYASIVEASGKNVDELFANGFVLTESLPSKEITVKINNKDTKITVPDFDDDTTKSTLESYIETATMHLMGKYSHDYGHNGVTIDDFYESFLVPSSTVTSVIGKEAYEQGGIIENVVIDGRTFTTNGLYFRSATVTCAEDQSSSASYDHGIRSQEAYVLSGTFTNNVAGKTISTKNSVTVPAPVIYASRISAVTLDNCDFENNQTGCIFVENECGHSAHNARVTVGNAVFNANTTTNSTGGIVDIEVGGNLYMGNSQITNNVIAGTNTSADGYGAAIYATQKSTEGDVNVYLEGSTFSGNTAAVEGFSRAVYVDQGLASGKDKDKTVYENYLFLDNTTFADENQRVVSLGQVNMRDTNTFAADFYNDGSHTVTFTTETDEAGNSVPAVMKFVNDEEIFVDAKMDTSTGNAQVVLDGCDTVNFGSFDANGCTYTSTTFTYNKQGEITGTVTVPHTVSTAADDLAAKLNADGTHKTLDEMDTLIGGNFDEKFTALDLNEADVIVNQETPIAEADFELGASHAYATGICLHEDVENVYYNGGTAASLENIDELQMMNKKRDIATGEHYDFGKLAYVVNYTMMAEAATAFTGTNSIWFNMGKQDLDNKYFVGNNTYQEAFHDRRATIIAGNNKVTNGGSINEGGAEMILEGTLFADEYSFELNNLTWDGSLYGGSKDTLRDDTKGTDLIINGVTFSGTNTQIVGGGQNCGTGTGDINVNINDSKLGSTASIYGAGETTDTNITTGDVNITIKAKNHDNLARIYAGGHANGANITTGDITTTITAENAARQFGAFYGGALLENGASFNAGTITTTISGGNFLSFVGNGSKTANGSGEVTTTIGDTSLAISGGSFANLVYAGGYSNGDGVKVGNSTLIISGGTFAKSVYGGCGANSDANGTKTEITGNVNVTVTATASSAVVFNSNLYAASMGAGQIDRSTYLTISGDGQYLTFGEASFVTGNSRMGEHIGSTKKVYVTGDRVLTFDGFNGAFGGNMSSGFSKLVFDGSSVSFTGATKVDLQFADTWEFEIGGTDAILTWDSVANSSAFNYNNFSGDTLNLTFDGSFTLASGSEATIIKGCDNTLRNWDKFASVTLNGSDNKLTFDKTENAYLGTVDGSNYKLYVDDTSKSLFLSHLA